MVWRNKGVYIGLGSNLNRPGLQIKKALIHLKNTNGLTLLDWSSLYLTAPVGYDDQPYFLNAVAKFHSKLSPLALLRQLQFVENKQLRKRTSNQNSPRTIDLDILLYGDCICSTENLIIPHPRMLERRFVLDPLLEISAKLIIPGSGAVVNYFSAVADQDCQRLERLLL